MTAASERRVCGRAVGRVGLGTATMTLRGDDDATVVEVVHAALDAGVRVIDSAAAYTPRLDAVGHGDRIVARAVSSWDGPTDEVVIITKGGHRRVADGFGPDAHVIDGRPGSIRADAETSLAALGTDHIDLYLLHAPDPDVPIVESFGAIVDLQHEGKVRCAGLSNVRLDDVMTASAVGEVAAVQNEFAVVPFPMRKGLPWKHAHSRPVLDWCATNEVPFLAYSPLGGVQTVRRLGRDVLPSLADVATRHGVSVQRVALAWLLQHHPMLLPLAGCSRAASIRDSAAAVNVSLGADDVAQLNAEILGESGS